LLRLRKILLCNFLYYIIFILVLLITIIRLVIPKTSIYSEDNTYIIGIITKLVIKDDKALIYVKNRETVIVTYYYKKISEVNKLSLGDKIKVIGEFTLPSSANSDYLFNYRKYLKRQNIFYLVKGESINKIRSNKNIYYFIKQILNKRFNNNPYLYTFILGDKSYLDKSVKRSYQENGISHLFAISGMHIQLLVNLIKKLLKRRKLEEEVLFKITSIILLIYLLLVGLSPSVVRGVLFYILFSINNIYYFYIKKENLFLLILAISLIINPNNIFDVGFQYSYLISFSLLMLSKYLEGNYIISLLKTSLISFFVSIPITIYNFYQLNLLSIIYNLFFVPFISIIIFPFSLILVIFSKLEFIYNFLINIEEDISLYLGKISIGKFIFKRVNIIIYFIYLILIIIFLFKPKKKIIITFLLILLIHFLIPYFDNSVYLKMIDVGQGDSILLHVKNKNILIDTGGSSAYSNDSSGEIFYNTIQPILKSSGIKKLNYLILTHGDKDHLGEAETLINNYKVDRIIINSNNINYYEKKLICNKTIIGEEGLTIKFNKFTMIQLNEDLDDENDSSQIYLV
jgi:competence protein ComEC